MDKKEGKSGNPFLKNLIMGCFLVIAISYIASAGALTTDQELHTPVANGSESYKNIFRQGSDRLLAQNQKNARVKDRGNIRRKKRISAKGKYRQSQGKATIDFDSVDIVGSRRSPVGSVINQTKIRKDYDFVKTRERWHPEMISSASSLDTGNH